MSKLLEKIEPWQKGLAIILLIMNAAPIILGNIRLFLVSLGITVLIVLLCLAFQYHTARPAPKIALLREASLNPDPSRKLAGYGMGFLLILAVLFCFIPSSHAYIWTSLGGAPLPTTSPIDTAGSKISNRDGMVMLPIPAGKFLMGSRENDPDADADEKPQRSVFLDAYWIGKTDVTNAMYLSCMKSGACAASPSNDYGDPRYRTYPVTATWDQARLYCEWADGRLPTEAEWEKAARGTNARIYPWGNTSPSGDLLNFADKNASQLDWADLNADDGYQYLSPVGNYPDGASPYGALDMAGNIWEWVADWYSPDYYASNSNQNPSGPLTGTERGLRGGSWYDVPNWFRSAKRYHNVPADTKNGFRCVFD